MARDVYAAASMPASASPRRLPKHDVPLGARARVRLWEHDGSFEVKGLAAHPGLELSCLAEGRATYRIGAQTLVATPGDVVVVPAQVEHHTTFDARIHGVALWLDTSLIAEITDAVTPRARGAPRLAGLANQGTMPTLFRLLEGEIVRRAAGWRLAADALLEAIVVELLRARTPPESHVGPRDKRIAMALEAIETRYAEPLSVDDLARAANMSRFHFSRLFRQEVGEAPYKHLLRVRIARAAELLRRGRRSVTEVALDVGFQDLSRFSSLFRTQIGSRPSEVVASSRARA